MRSVTRMTRALSDYARKMSVKTKELGEEKKWTDQLLCQMLPKSVAGSVETQTQFVFQYQTLCRLCIFYHV